MAKRKHYLDEPTPFYDEKMPGESDAAFWARQERLDQDACGDETGHDFVICLDGVLRCQDCNKEPTSYDVG